jgi:nucleosome binding factor SPN SPT16 subunit
VIDTGANNEDEIYSKSKALQTWLVGYELTETIILICSRSVHVLTGKKKGACAQSATRASPESV